MCGASWQPQGYAFVVKRNDWVVCYVFYFLMIRERRRRVRTSPGSKFVHPELMEGFSDMICAAVNPFAAAMILHVSPETTTCILHPGSEGAVAEGAGASVVGSVVGSLGGLAGGSAGVGSEEATAHVPTAGPGEAPLTGVPRVTLGPGLGKSRSTFSTVAQPLPTLATNMSGLLSSLLVPSPVIVTTAQFWYISRFPISLNHDQERMASPEAAS